MAEPTRLVCCVLVLCLASLHLASSVDVTRLCANRCLRGSGGILCNCNAMHFKGKRSELGASQTTQQDSNHYLTTNRHHRYGAGLNQSPSILDSDPFALTSLGDGAGVSGSKTSYASSRETNTPLDSSWDNIKVHEFIDSLRSLENHGRPTFARDLVENSRGHDYLERAAATESDVLPFILFATGAEGKGHSRRTSSPLSSHPTKLKSFGKTHRTNQVGSFRGKTTEDITDQNKEFLQGNGSNTHDEGLRGPKDSFDSEDSSFPAGSPQVTPARGHLFRLQQALRQALAGR